MMGYLESIMGKSEEIVFRTRRHWFVIARDVIVSVLLSLLVIAVVVALLAPTHQYSALGLLLLVLTLGFLFITCLQWWNEQYIVTNRRIVQMDGVLNKHVIDSSLEKVNDVVLDQSYLGRLLDYGNLEILTASDIGINKLWKLSHPITFKKAMLNAKEAMGMHDDVPMHGADHTGKAQPTVPELITQLATLRDQGVLTEEEFQTKKTELMSRL
jgi:uncharacterized membrane protein YdbT with pleckstrin-like domain